jgi:hypothetical protein
VEGRLPFGLKAHTHEERRRIADMVVPLIVRHMGRDLLALAQTGSFARNSDQPFSDLDFIGFVRHRQNSDREIVNLIFDGLLIHIWFLTRDDYLSIHKNKVGAQWPYAAAITLVPLINEPFIRSFSDVPPNNNPEDYRAAIYELWPFVQEATSKLLNAVSRRNDEAVYFLYWSMAEKLTVILSLLNAKPVSTRSSVFADARTFALLPDNYLALLDPGSGIGDINQLGQRALAAFEGTERLLHAQGLRLYAENLDCFVKPLGFGGRLRSRLWSNRLFHRAAHAADRIRKQLRNSSGSRS